MLESAEKKIEEAQKKEAYIEDDDGDGEPDQPANRVRCRQRAPVRGRRADASAEEGVVGLEPAGAGR